MPETLFTKEQQERLILEVTEHIRQGTFSKYRGKGLAKLFRELKEEDGTYVFRDTTQEGNVPIGQWAMEKRISRLRQDWKKYLAEDMEYLMIEAAYIQAQKAKESPTSFNAMTKVLEMDKNESNKEGTLKISAGAITILQRKGVGTAIVFGKNPGLVRMGTEGHECPDTSDTMATGQLEDITIEGLPSGDDSTLHGGDSLSDLPEGSLVPDSEMAFEDATDNDGGADMDAFE